MEISKFRALSRASEFLSGLSDDTVLTMDLMGPVEVAIPVPKNVVVDFFEGMDPRDFKGVQFIAHGTGVHVDFIMD